MSLNSSLTGNSGNADLKIELKNFTYDLSLKTGHFANCVLQNCQKLLQITAALLRVMKILIANYCKIITNYGKDFLQITTGLLQITGKCYYKLRQKIITNYGSTYVCKMQNFYTLCQVLLQITAALSVITNYGKFY